MKASISYLKKEKFEESLELEDIGNCSLLAYDSLAQEYYFNIVSILGDVTVKKFGPLQSDNINIDHYFSYTKFTHSYDEKKIHKDIYTFINSYDICQVEEISIDKFFDKENKIKELL